MIVTYRDVNTNVSDFSNSYSVPKLNLNCIRGIDFQKIIFPLYKIPAYLRHFVIENMPNIGTYRDNNKSLSTRSRVGTFGALMEYGIERRLTPHSNLGATMVVGIPFGVTLKIKFTRASQTYTFPIHLADEVSVAV